VTARSSVERAALERDLRTLRDRSSNRTTTVPSTDLATGRANPPKRPHRDLAATHDDLRGRADRTVRQRARVAAREAYLRALEARLAERATRQNDVSEGLTDDLDTHLSPGGLNGALSADRTPSTPAHRTWSDPAGNLSLRVATGPSYLPTSEVERDRIGARRNGTVHPLKTRNLNVFASPHGQAARRIVEQLPVIGADTVSPVTAAQALARMNASDDGYESLRAEVATANEHVRQELREAMKAAGIPGSAADTVLATDASTAVAGSRLANGSTVDRAVELTGSHEDVDRDRLRVRLHLAHQDALTHNAARPSLSTTNEATAELKREFRARLETVLADRFEASAQRARTKALGKKMGSLPAGMPIAPVPTHWYATGNVWVVEVQGTYERFVVRANRGDARAAVTYVREGRNVTLRRRGRTLELGRDERVSIRAETAVVLVVPTGPTGVGDTDGEMDERSPGWPPENDTADA
jgi:DnaJ-domain-containing protein 1